MPIILGVISFIFYRVIFKMMYGATLSVFADILVCAALVLLGVVLNNLMMKRFGTEIAAKRFGTKKTSFKTFSPFLGLIILSTLFSMYSWVISYGFSEKFFNRTWDDATEPFDFILICFVFCIPLFSHYAVNKWALNTKLKQVEKP